MRVIIIDVNDSYQMRSLLKDIFDEKKIEEMSVSEYEEFRKK